MLEGVYIRGRVNVHGGVNMNVNMRIVDGLSRYKHTSRTKESDADLLMSCEKKELEKEYDMPDLNTQRNRRHTHTLTSKTKDREKKTVYHASIIYSSVCYQRPTISVRNQISSSSIDSRSFTINPSIIISFPPQ